MTLVDFCTSHIDTFLSQSAKIGNAKDVFSIYKDIVIGQSHLRWLSVRPLVLKVQSFTWGSCGPIYGADTPAQGCLYATLPPPLNIALSQKGFQMRELCAPNSMFSYHCHQLTNSSSRGNTVVPLTFATFLIPRL